MKKKIYSPAKERMIHIRLDEKTHRELKLHAVSNDTTVQSVVEDLIRNKLRQEVGRSKSGSRRRSGK